MKKFYAFFLAILILLTIPVVSFAKTEKDKEDKEEIDLSELSFDELVELKDRINMAIWESEEWQEVEVPQGVWEVGEDIPAGKWTIRALDEGTTSISVGKELKNGGTDVKVISFQQVRSPLHRSYKDGKDVPEWTIELEEGQFVQIQSGTAVFSPYSGKPSLGFKNN